MSSQHIEISPSATRLSGKLRYAIDQLRQTQEAFAELKGIADQAAFGGAYADFGTLFGVETPAANGEAVYNLLGSVTTTLQGDAFIAQLLSRCG
jgi:hypothetical protein